MSGSGRLGPLRRGNRGAVLLKYPLTPTFSHLVRNWGEKGLVTHLRGVWGSSEATSGFFAAEVFLNNK